MRTHKTHKALKIGFVLCGIAVFGAFVLVFVDIVLESMDTDKNLCDSRVKEACLRVADGYEEKALELGDKEQWGLAMEYYLKACELQSAEGCYKYAQLYGDGYRSYKERKIDKELDELAAKGNLLALAGKAAHNSRGTKYVYMKKACELGHTRACEVLEAMHKADKQRDFLF